jgi:hypothetical protein
MSGFTLYGKHASDGIPAIQAATRKQQEQVLADAAELDRINAETRARFGLPPASEKRKVKSETGESQAVERWADQLTAAGATVTVAKKPVERWEPRATAAEHRELARLLTSGEIPGLRRALIDVAGARSQSLSAVVAGDHQCLAASVMQRIQTYLASGMKPRPRGRQHGYKVPAPADRSVRPPVLSAINSQPAA